MAKHLYSIYLQSVQCQSKMFRPANINVSVFHFLIAKGKGSTFSLSKREDGTQTLSACHQCVPDVALHRSQEK